MPLQIDIRKILLFTFLMYSGFLYKFVFNRLGIETVVVVGGVFALLSYTLLGNKNALKTVNPFLVAILIWVFCSAFWSSNFSETMLKATLLLITVITCKILVDGNRTKFLHTFLWFVVVSIIINVLALIFLKQYAYRSGNVSGLFYSKNDFGIFLGVSFLFTIFTFGIKNKLTAVIAFFCLIMLFFVKSKTVIGVVFITLVLSALKIPQFYDSLKNYFYKNRNIKVFVSICFFWLLVLTFIPALETAIESLPSEFMTGRGYIWDLTLSKQGAGGIFGYGYGVHWLETYLLFGDINSPQLNWLQTIEQAHNGYLEVYASIGLIGVSLLLLYIRSNLKKFKNLMFPFYLTVFAIIHNLTESTWLWGMHFLFVIYLLVTFSHEEK